MKILFLQKRPLLPANTGGRIRTLNVLKFLARWHDVTYLCNVRPDEHEHIDSMRALGLSVEAIPWREHPRYSVAFYRDVLRNVFSRFPYSVVKDYHRALHARARALVARNDYDLLICDFVQMARNAVGLAVPASILFQHNVEAAIYARHARHDRGWLRRSYMKLQALKMGRFEVAAGRTFSTVVAVSAADRAYFESRDGWSHVACIDTAVDTDFFQARPAEEQSGRLVFVGSLDWLPNEDGIVDFVARTWPRIRRVRPDATLHVVGRQPTTSVLELAKQPGVQIFANVADVRPHLAEAAVVIVPLRIGGGTRLKIFEAMAMNKAVVSTTLGAEGLAVRHDEHLLIGDTPEAFALAALRLLADASLRHDMGLRAGHYVRRYGAEIVARQFEAICQKTVASAARPTSSVNRHDVSSITSSPEMMRALQ